MEEHGFPCQVEECGRLFTTKFNLVRHISTVHLRIRKWKCSICGLKFGSKQNLQEHENIHSKTRDCACKQCGKSFSIYAQLESHKIAHKTPIVRFKIENELKLTEIMADSSVLPAKRPREEFEAPKQLTVLPPLIRSEWDDVFLSE